MPFPGGAKDEIPAVGRADKSVQEQISELVEKEHLLLTKEANQEKERPSSETLTQIAKNLPRLIQKALQKVEASQVYQTFKLPGRDYLVHDKRDKEALAAREEKKDAIAEEAKKPLQELLLQKGKLISTKEKKYENYLEDPASKLVSPEQRAARERVIEFFSRFEKTLLRRFEEGKEVAQKTKEGEPSFLKKTIEQWQNFFAHFVQRTVKRHASLEQIQEWIYRGLVQRQARATVISDWALANGQMEKFVRFRLLGEAQNLLALLGNLAPGTSISKEELRKYLTGDLEYLAIKGSEESATFAQALQKGKFLTTAQAEERVASDLGLQQKVSRDLVGKRKKGFGSGFDLGGEEEAVDQGSPFVPWWQFGPLRKGRGPMRWFVILTFLAILGLVVVGLLSLL